MTWDVISLLASLAWNLWLWSCIVLRFTKMFGKDSPRLLVFLREEIRPFAPAVATVPFLVNVFTGEAGRWTWLAVPMNLFCWWIYRNDKDDDDRWKRRREKLAARVAEVGGRLQVVPVSSS